MVAKVSPQPQTVQQQQNEAPKPGLSTRAKVAIVVSAVLAGLIALVVIKALITATIVVLAVTGTATFVAHALKKPALPMPTPFVDKTANNLVRLETTMTDYAGKPVKVVLQEENHLSKIRQPARYRISPHWTRFKSVHGLTCGTKCMSVENLGRWLTWCSSDQIDATSREKFKALDPLLIPIDLPRDEDYPGEILFSVVNAFKAVRNFLNQNSVKTPEITIYFSTVDKTPNDVEDVSPFPGLKYDLTALHKQAFET